VWGAVINPLLVKSSAQWPTPSTVHGRRNAALTTNAPVPGSTESQVATWTACLLNPLIGLDDSVCASPYDVLRKFQLWRLISSLLYVPGLMNALIMSFVLYRLAAAWERERGSIRIAYYFLLAAGPCS